MLLTDSEVGYHFLLINNAYLRVHGAKVCICTYVKNVLENGRDFNEQHKVMRRIPLLYSIMQTFCRSFY